MREESRRYRGWDRGGGGGGGGGGGVGAELEGLQEHQPSSVDQHFLRDLQGPVG